MAESYAKSGGGGLGGRVKRQARDRSQNYDRAGATLGAAVPRRGPKMRPTFFRSSTRAAGGWLLFTIDL
jgi:hypothetical protein